MRKKSKLKKWMIGILIAIGGIFAVAIVIFVAAVVIFGGLIVYDVISDSEFQQGIEQVILITVDTMPGTDRPVILRTELEAAGYMYERPWLPTGASPEITHHIYVGQLDDSYIFIVVRQNLRNFERSIDISDAIVEGFLSPSGNNPQMRRFINNMINEDGTSWDEIHEIFTPHFIEVRNHRNLRIVE